jgi:hypothetical protein
MLWIRGESLGRVSGESLCRGRISIGTILEANGGEFQFSSQLNIQKGSFSRRVGKLWGSLSSIASGLNIAAIRSAKCPTVG